MKNKKRVKTSTKKWEKAMWNMHVFIIQCECESKWNGGKCANLHFENIIKSSSYNIFIEMVRCRQGHTHLHFVATAENLVIWYWNVNYNVCTSFIWYSAFGFEHVKCFSVVQWNR